MVRILWLEDSHGSRCDKDRLHEQCKSCMYYATAPALIILKMIYERAATEAL